MQFKYPELLYALLLLLIPIIIHLFQLRRFQKVTFTNVQFLKQVTLQTRKSSQLKKWLTLLTRLLLFAAIVLAFSQPYLSKLQNLKTNTETVIYLDNSFSMQARGNKGELLKRAIQDIIDVLEDKEEVTIYTNNSSYTNVRKNTVKSELLQLSYSNNQLDYEAIILKGKQFFSKDISSIKRLILLSDFQKQQKDFIITPDSLIDLRLVKLQPIKTNNISIDSVFISKNSASTLELTVLLEQESKTEDNISISLFNNDKLIAKSSVNEQNSLKSTFTLPNNIEINGKFEVKDASLQFDNHLFFNINNRQKIKVLSINSTKNKYLNRVFTDDEFIYNSTIFNQLDYNEITQQNLIILNELESFSTSLINALQSFTSHGGNILIIPSDKASISSYNQLFINYKNIKLNSLISSEKKITTINYSHPIFKDVFDKKVVNFQYPKVNLYYTLTSTSTPILELEDGNPFLIQSGELFVFSAPMNSKNSNFNNSPLIVPTLYNIGKQSLKLPKLYYTIGKENIFDVTITMQEDDILKFKSNTLEIIPLQHTYSNKVTVSTNETPAIADIYTISSKLETIEHVSYNYNRNESKLDYLVIDSIKNVRISNSTSQLFSDIKSETNIDELWKWFVIFAIVLLIIEMLILKYFK